MKLLVLIPALVLSLGMGGKPVRKNPAPLPQKPAEERPQTPSPSVEPRPGEVTVSATIKGLPEDAKRIERLGRLTPSVQKVLNHPDFEARMLKAWWNGKPGFQDSSDSPAQVIAKLKGSPWNQVYEFSFQKDWKGKCPVTGWTYPNTKTVWFNRCNFDWREDCGIIGTRFHEETHKRGYDHATSKRHLSVPYYTGTQAAVICNQLKKEGKL